MRNFFYLLLLFALPAMAQDDVARAKKLLESKHYAESSKICKALIAENPRDIEALECLGDIDAVGKKWQSASGYYKRAIAVNASLPELHYKYGGALAMLVSGNKLKALSLIDDIRTSFEKTLQLNPSHINARWALVEYYLQVPGIFGGSEAKAAKYANELAPLSPVDYYLAKGRIDEYFERFEKAEKQYMKANEIGRSDATAAKLNAIRVKIRNAKS